MSAAFDPYHRWLGIAPEEQPPHHYRLLGLKLFEGDADVIESAADKQMTHVRSFQSGQHADDSQRLLNEISAAKLLLLDVDKKAEYDAHLRAKLDHIKRRRKQERPLPVAQPLTASTESPDLPPAVDHTSALDENPAPQPFIQSHAPHKKPRLPKAVLHAAVACGVALILLGGAIVVIVQTLEPPQEVADVGGASGNAANAATTEHTANTGGGAEVDSTGSNVQPPPPPPPVDAIDPGEVDTTTTSEPPPVDPPPVDPDSDSSSPESVDDAGPQRQPVPDAAAREAARTRIASIFAPDDAQTPQAKAALASQMLKVASETKDDPVARFVLLNLAREQAADAAQLQLALQAVDLLEAGYDFDASSVRLATLGQAVKAPLPPAEKREVIVIGMAMMDALVERDEFDTADKLVDPLFDIVRRAKDAKLLQALAERRKRADELKAAYRRVKSAIDTLKDDPDNADANLSAGRYYLFAKGRWSTGLPMLAKGSDEKLAAAAQAEIQRPSTTEHEEKLADAWWSIAEDETDKAAQQLLLDRAMAWYLRAENKLSGLAKVKAQQRLRQLADAGVRPGDVTADLGVFSRPPTGLGTPPIDDAVGLEFTGLSPDTRVQKLEVGARRCTGQFSIIKVPEELQGLDFLTVSRPDGKKPGRAWKMTVNQRVRVYLLYKDRGEPNAPGWQLTEHTVEWKATETLRFVDPVYVRVFPAGEISIPAHTGRNSDGLYGVPHSCAVEVLGTSANSGSFRVISEDPAEPKLERPPELPKLPETPAPDAPQSAVISDAAKLLVLYRWGREIHVDGKRTSETVAFAFSPDGDCRGTGGSGFVSGAKTWKMEGDTLIFGGRRLELANGIFHQTTAGREQWTLRPLGPAGR